MIYFFSLGVFLKFSKGCVHLTNYEYISCLISGFSSLISFAALVVAALASYYAWKNLEEIKKQFFEQNRGNLVFFIIDRNTSPYSGLYSTIVKNFGNSPAKLISLTIDPELDWSKTEHKTSKNFVISKSKNVFIAPGQFIESVFDFSNYPDEEFHIDIKYETMGKKMSESYNINLEYTNNKVTPKIDTKDTLTGLHQINNSIRELSDKFL